MSNRGSDGAKTARVRQSDADECVNLTKTIGPPGDNMLSRFQEDVMYHIRSKLEKVEAPAEVSVTIEVDEVDGERQCNECGDRLATDWEHGWVCLSCGEPREGPTRE